MLTNICLSHLRTVGQCLRHQTRRSLGSSAVLAQKADDPIQQLFVEKIREYAKKKKAAGGKMVDATPEAMKDYDAEVDRLQKQYSATGRDMSKFPSFTFVEKELESPLTQEERDPKDLPL